MFRKKENFKKKNMICVSVRHYSLELNRGGVRWFLNLILACNLPKQWNEEKMNIYSLFVRTQQL